MAYNRLIVPALIVLAGVIAAVTFDRLTASEPPSMLSSAWLLQLDDMENNSNDGFAAVDQPWDYRFPVDHAAHPDFRAETWSLWTMVETDQGRRLGLQLDLVRLALSPTEPDSTSAWATRQVYRGQLLLTDPDDQRFDTSERFSRAALGLAGTDDNGPVRVWIDDWQLNIDDQTINLQADDDSNRYRLTLTTKSPPVTFDGDQNQGFYGYMLPELAVTGQINGVDNNLTVNGYGWLDRSWGGLLLPQGQLAPNRFQLQLDDGRTLVLLQLHRRDGSGTPLTTGLLIDPNGETRSLERQQIELTALDQWSNSTDPVRYPSGWRLKIVDQQIDITLTPLLADQEARLMLRYWSGLVTLIDHSQQPVGRGRVILTGYDSVKAN